MRPLDTCCFFEPFPSSLVIEAHTHPRMYISRQLYFKAIVVIIFPEWRVEGSSLFLGVCTNVLGGLVVVNVHTHSTDDGMIG